MREAYINDADFERAHSLRPIVIAGVAVVAVFFVGIVGWAATAPLRGAAIAKATVAPEGHRKTIQHLEGGIVREILVRDGSEVAAGTVLVRLDNTQAAAEVAVLRRTIAKEREAIKGLEASIVGYTQQISLIDEEIATVDKLLKRGLERKPRLLALQRHRVGLMSGIATSEGEIAVANEAILEAEDKLVAAADRLSRNEVLAPIDGIVVDLRVKTLGGVVGPGEPILDIVPAGDRLVLEARVSPNDIDEVGVGQEAQVYLLAYRTRHLPRVEGVVEQVSADRLIDPKTQEAYYAARIAVASDQLEALGPGIVLTPGMPAEALIMTRERTVLDYLLAPLTDVLRRGGREA